MLTIDNIYSAAQRIKKYIHRTPILTCSTLNSITKANLFFKCENFQKVGAFKFRGATNATLLLDPNKKINGVATHSSGNHAAALALAAKLNNIKAYVVMPDNSPDVKKQAVLGYGAKIIYCEPNLNNRETALNKVIEHTNATFIHPFDNEHVIAGQGTAALELLQEYPDLDVLITPVGGGGLLSGSAIAAKSLLKNITVIGAEPELANDAYESFRAKKIVPAKESETICDGLLTSLGNITFPIIYKNVNEIMMASEDSILKATKYILERMKIVVEPSAAITLAVILQHGHVFKGKNIGLILSGGNLSLKSFYS